MDFDLAGIRYELPKKPKFDRDFIMLSEFSELVGPVPVCFIPEEKAKGNFNANHFSVRIMSSDFQTATGKVVGEDTQIILSEKQDGAFAYVHYFSLNDNNARGYVRQYCLSYITTSSSKIVDNFDELLKQFSEVTAILKVSNHRLYQRDMSRHLADLELTMSLLKEEGWIDANADPNDLYSGFDFTKEDVPERDPSLVQEDMEETKAILEAVKEELSKETNVQVWEDLQRQRSWRRQQRQRERSNTYPLETPTRSESGFISYLPISPDLESKLSTSLSSSGSSEYEPQRVMTHLVHKFERRLRPLEELAPKACSVAMDKLKEIHKFFCRSEQALEMEREETLLLEPRSALLSIGRVPTMNVLQDFSPPHPQAPPPPYDSIPQVYQSYRKSLPSISTFLRWSSPYRLSSRNTWGMPNQQAESSIEMPDDQSQIGFDSSFVDDKLGLKQFPLYIDSTHMPNRWYNSESMATEPPEYEHTLTLSTATSKLDTDSETCLLPVPHDEEDGGASGTSTTFATPEGLTPKSSDEEGDSKLRNSSTALEGSGGFNQGSGSHRSMKDKIMHQNRLNVPEVSSRLGHVLTHHQNDHSHTNGLEESQDQESEEDNVLYQLNGSVLCGEVTTKECVESNGLEKSEGSSTCLQSGSGSQCTLTDSRESTNLADITSTQVQASQTGQTGHENKSTPVEAVDGNVSSHPRVQDGTVPTYMTQVPPHLLSINSSEWLGGSEVVTSQPQENGYRWSDVGDTTPTWRPEDSGESREQPVAVIYSSSRGSESEESLSAGSGCYDPTDKGILAVSEVTVQQGVQPNHRKSPSLSQDAQQRTSPGRHEIAEASGILQDMPDRTSVTSHTVRVVDTSQPRTSGQHGKLSSEEGVVKQRSSPKVSGLVMATKHSPVGSTGTGSSTSEEQPVPAGRPVGSVGEDQPPMAARMEKQGGVRSGWARKKTKESRYPPSELQMKIEQGSPPDSFHTPNTNFPAGPPGGPVYPGGAGFYGDSPKSLQRFFSAHGEHGGPLGSLSSPLSPSQRSHTSVSSLASMDTVFSANDSSLYIPRGPAILGKCCLPLVSTVDHVEGLSKFKPGKGIANFCKNTPIVTDLLYCLLQGRPLVLLGKKDEENLIRRLIRVLWLFVPGHSSQRQVITWQETPLDIRDLSRVKLIGLCNKSTNAIGSHIKPYVSYWDCSTGKLCTPSYSGDLIKSMVTRTKDKKNEEVFLTHIHSVLMEIAMKAYVYYHGYCTAISTNQTSSPLSDHSPKKRHTVLEKTTAKKKKTTFLQNLGIKNSDVDIIEYFVDVIREQQLIEWGQESTNGGPFDDNPVRIQLQPKHCSESLCKPKRPY